MLGINAYLSFFCIVCDLMSASCGKEKADVCFRTNSYNFVDISSRALLNPILVAFDKTLVVHSEVISVQIAPVGASIIGECASMIWFHDS